MRWKLLRRRLSVSAPRVAVRSQLPWPLRWAAGALALGFSAALALWAFELGKDIAGLDRNTQTELAALRQAHAQLLSEHEQVRQTANAAETLLTAERAAQEALAQQIRRLDSEKQALREDLGFFEQLLPAVGDGLQVRGLRAEPAAPGQLRFQMLVMQNARASGEFSGGFELLLTGDLDGKPWVWASPQGRQPLTLRQYIRVEGMIDHPVDAVIKAVQVRVTDRQGGMLVSQTTTL